MTSDIVRMSDNDPRHLGRAPANKIGRGFYRLSSFSRGVRPSVRREPVSGPWAGVKPVRPAAQCLGDRRQLQEDSTKKSEASKLDR